MNDNHGHEAGDRLLKKAADSLRAVEEGDIMAFRVGGDEFILVGLRLDRAAAEALKRRWEEALERLNAQDDGVNCVMACGMVCGERGYDLDELLAEADERMYCRLPVSVSVWARCASWRARSPAADTRSGRGGSPRTFCRSKPGGGLHPAGSPDARRPRRIWRSARSRCSAP